MKKVSINILSALVVLILAVAYIFPAITTLAIIISGFTSTPTETAASSLEGRMPVMTIMSPSQQLLENPTDTMTFDNGVRHPAIVQEAIVMVPDHRFYYESFTWDLVIYALTVILYIVLLFFLIRFIININKGLIFVKSNGMYLRTFGWILIVISVVECLNGYIQVHMVDIADLHRAGYEFLANWQFPWSTFVLGLVALLLGQVWSLGIRMQEEQELTI